MVMTEQEELEVKRVLAERAGEKRMISFFNHLGELWRAGKIDAWFGYPYKPRWVHLSSDLTQDSVGNIFMYMEAHPNTWDDNYFPIVRVRIPPHPRGSAFRLRDGIGHNMAEFKRVVKEILKS